MADQPDHVAGPAQPQQKTGLAARLDPRRWLACMNEDKRALLIFTGLIALDLGAVGASAVFVGEWVSQFRASHDASDDWVRLQQKLADLNKYGSELSAAGNDVFVDRDVDTQRFKLTRAVLDFSEALAIFRQHAVTLPESPQRAHVLKLLEHAEWALPRISRQTDRVFRALSNNRLQTATEEMASLDAQASDLSRSLAQLSRELNEHRFDVLSAQHELLRRDEAFGVFVAALVFLSVLVTGVYGGMTFAKFRQMLRQQRMLADQQSESAGKLQAILDTANDGILTIDAGGIVTSINPAACAVFGYRESEVLGRNISMLMPAPDRDRHDGYIGAYQASGVAKIIGKGREVRGQRKNGETFALELSIAETWANGRRSFTGFVRDISARKAAEDRARLLSDIVASSEDAIISKTLDGVITTWNKGAERLFGYEATEIVGRPIATLIPQDRSNEENMIISRISAGDYVSRFETERLHKNGALIPIAVTVSPIRDATGHIIGASKMARDISAHKRADATIAQYMEELEGKSIALAEARDVAEAGARLKSEFLANMSHEIRTPMNGIIGMGNLLLDTPLSEQQKHYCQAALRSAEGLLQIINDVLDFSKIEAGKLALEPQNFDLLTLIEDTVEIVSISAAERGLDLIVSYDLGAPRTFIGDPGRVRQIMLNMLTNAVKFTEQGYVRASVSVTAASDGRAHILMKFEDTGIGMSRDALAQIFEKFSQADNSITRRFGGTGLGFSITQRLAEMMGGRIDVQSTPGVGSAFSIHIELPVAESERTSDTAHRGALNAKRVLIAAQTPASLEAWREVFIEAGAQVDTARDCVGADQFVIDSMRRNQPYDVAIVDVDMATDEREALVAALCRRLAVTETPVLAVGCAHRRTEAAPIQAMGAAGLLNSPLAAVRLVEASQKVLAAQARGESLFVTRHNLRPGADALAARAAGEPLFANAQVLLAEDNPVNLEVATTMLEKLGCRVTPAGNGSEAVRQFLQQPFDVVLLDCQMPVLDGFAATANMRRIEADRAMPPTPIIAFTANAMRGDAEACIAAGMNDHMAKPITRQVLERTLLKWMPRARRAARAEAEPTALEPEIAAPPLSAEIIDDEAYEALRALMKSKFPLLLEKYLVSAAAYVAETEQAAARDDAAAVAEAAHPLKSSSANFGAREVMLAAAGLEQRALEGASREHLMEGAQKLRAAFEAASAALSAKNQDARASA